MLANGLEFPIFVFSRITVEWSVIRRLFPFDESEKFAERWMFECSEMIGVASAMEEIFDLLNALNVEYSRKTQALRPEVEKIINPSALTVDSVIKKTSLSVVLEYE